MMRAYVPCFALLAAACGGYAYGDDLSGSQKVAWETCRERLSDDWVNLANPPMRVSQSNDFITFHWDETNVMKLGGVNACVTTGDGLTIVRIVELQGSSESLPEANGDGSAEERE